MAHLRFFLVVRFINTLHQRGVWRWRGVVNRFNGFAVGRVTMTRAGKPLERLQAIPRARKTPLKQGVNESAGSTEKSGMRSFISG